MTDVREDSASTEPKRSVQLENGFRIGIPDDAVEEGGFFYWIDGEAPNLRIMCAGGAAGPQQVFNAEYPDEIFDREQELMRAYESRMQ